MTTETVVIDAATITCNSWVDPRGMSSLVELETRYGLIYFHSETNKAIEKAMQLVGQADLNWQWARKRERLTADKTEVTQFMVDFIENQPESLEEYQMANRSRP